MWREGSRNSVCFHTPDRMGSAKQGQSMSKKCKYTDNMFGLARQSNEHMMTSHHHEYHTEMEK